MKIKKTKASGTNPCGVEVADLPKPGGCPADSEYFFMSNVAVEGGYALRSWQAIKECLGAGLDTNFANTNLVFNANRVHELDGYEVLIKNGVLGETDYTGFSVAPGLIKLHVVDPLTDHNNFIEVTQAGIAVNSSDVVGVGGGLRAYLSSNAVGRFGYVDSILGKVNIYAQEVFSDTEHRILIEDSGITMTASTGGVASGMNLAIKQLSQNTTGYALYYDPETGLVSYGLAGSGGGALRFGIEDNLGVQDRDVDMERHNFTLANTGVFSIYTTNDIEVGIVDNKSSVLQTDDLGSLLFKGSHFKEPGESSVILYVSPTVATIQKQIDGAIISPPKEIVTSILFNGTEYDADITGKVTIPGGGGGGTDYNFAEDDLTATGNRTHSFGSFSATITGNLAGNLFTTTNSNGIAIVGNSSAGTGIVGNGVFGGQFYGSVYGITAGTYGGNFAVSAESDNADGNTVSGGIQISRAADVPATAGIGTRITFNMHNEVNTYIGPFANQIVSKLTTVTEGSEVAELSFLGAGGGTIGAPITNTLFTLSGNGQARLNQYGSTGFTGTATKWLAVTSDGTIIQENPPSGGGGGSMTANNGLVLSTSTNIQLGAATAPGSPLLHNSFISTGDFYLAFNTSVAGAIPILVNATTGKGILASATNGVALQGYATGFGIGVEGQSENGVGVVAESRTKWAIDGGVYPATGDTEVPVINLSRSTTGTPLPGIGGSAQFQVKDDANSIVSTGWLGYIATSVTHNAESSKFFIDVVRLHTRQRAFEIANTSQAKLNKYGINTFAGTPAYGLGVDATGSIVEYVPGSGGGGGSDRTKWMGDWVQQSYSQYEQVLDNSFLAIANKNTEDRPAPQPIGQPGYIYTAASIPTTSVSAKQVIFGNRYTFSKDVIISAWRVNVIAGNSYSIYLVENPSGASIISQIINYTAQRSGWVSLNIPKTLIKTGSTYDLVATVSEPATVPVIFSANYDYKKPTNFSTVNAGEIVQANSSINTLRVHKTDYNAINQTAGLTALTIGDIIICESTRWAIQSKTDSGTYFTFVVSPATQIAGNGLKTFQFETVSSTPITYPVAANYWGLNPPTNIVAQGLLAINASYFSITPNTSAYGVDILIQEIIPSPDWDIQAFSESGNIDTETDPEWIADKPNYATLASPAFTGTPTAPTAAPATNTTQIATTAFVQTAILSGSIPARTGGVVAFDIPSVYNTPSAPTTFTSLDLTGAVANTEVVGYFNNAIIPAFGAGTYVSGAWNPSQLNCVRFLYVNSTNISVIISSGQAPTTNIDTRVQHLLVTGGSNPTTTSTSASQIPGLEFTAAINSQYLIEAYILQGSGANTGGAKLGWIIPSSGATLGSYREGRTTSTSVGLAAGDIQTISVISSTAWGAYVDGAGIIFKPYQHIGILTTTSTSGQFGITFASVVGGQLITVYKDASFVRVTKIS